MKITPTSSFDWADGDRGLRIEQMIEARIANGGKISAADFAEIQFDGYSFPAATFVPLLPELSSDDSQVQEAWIRLRDWDYQQPVDSVPAALFEMFYTRLHYNILQDEVGEENVDTIIGRDMLMYELAANLDDPLWDNVNTPERETAVSILHLSLREAIEWLGENVGGNMDSWTWGKIHTITFADAVLGASGIAPVEAIFNRGPFPVAGGADLVNANNWRRTAPALVRANPSMRMIIDLSDFERNQAILPTGQSGHPFHPNYDDQMALWLVGEYHLMLWGRTAVESAAVNHLILRP
jgi:penicillin G amidase